MQFKIPKRTCNVAALKTIEDSSHDPTLCPHRQRSGQLRSRARFTSITPRYMHTAKQQRPCMPYKKRDQGMTNTSGPAFHSTWSCLKIFREGRQPIGRQDNASACLKGAWDKRSCARIPGNALRPHLAYRDYPATVPDRESMGTGTAGLQRPQRVAAALRTRPPRGRRLAGAQCRRNQQTPRLAALRQLPARPWRQGERYPETVHSSLLLQNPGLHHRLIARSQAPQSYQGH